MARIALLLSALIVLTLGCEEGDTYVTNNTSPEDWQPPMIEWRTQPNSEVRGMVGIDFEISDSSEVASIRAYLNGAPSDSTFAPPYRFELITDSLLDGVHLIEIRATDAYGNLGISPILRINVSNSVAQGPQLIWVPDDFARIQDAINASTVFDTIRVRDGVYVGPLNLFGKGIWVESENGPLLTTIDGNNSSDGIYVSPCSTPAIVRGFTLTNAHYPLRIEGGAFVRIYSNLFLSDSASGQIITSRGGGEIHNNLFLAGEYGVLLSYFWGTFYNNILLDAQNAAMWNGATQWNPLQYGYNLFWNNGYDYDQFEPGEGDIYVDPLIDLTNGNLLPGSPAVDAGNPQFLDQDSSRSDIGPFGGPWAY